MINLLTSGRLNSYLTDIDEQSGNMFSQLIKEYADRQGVTEQLKARNQLEWVGKMNNIRNQAMEIVDKEILYPLIR
ncbi:MAG: TnpV protein [Clostridiales bacterium]|nr:TnpV protein [Clostridiales bacterium]